MVISGRLIVHAPVQAQAVILAQSLEPYRLFFWEDGLPPEQNDHFKLIRQHSSVPIAMGELFVNVHEYLPLIQVMRASKMYANMSHAWLTDQQPAPSRVKLEVARPRSDRSMRCRGE